MHYPSFCVLFLALAHAQDFPLIKPPSNFSSSLKYPSSTPTPLTTLIPAETSTGSLPVETELDTDTNDHGALAPIELTPQESIDSTGFDIEMYAQLLVSPRTSTTTTTPDPSENGNKAAPVVIPSCPDAVAVKNAKRGLSSREGIGKGLDKRGRPKRPVFRKCTPTTLVIDVKFHYVANGFFLVFPPEIETRIQKQVDFMNQILAPQGITLNFLNDPDIVISSTFTEYGYYGNDLTRAKQARTQQNDAFMRETRIGGPDVFNVWIVNSMKTLDDAAFKPAGHAYFPEWKKFDHDGVVMKLSALRTASDTVAQTNPSRRGGVLVHEFGHWMGLLHQFGDTDCGTDDGIADTPRFSNAIPGLSQCLQTRCGLPNETPIRVQNWMSYSSCRGVQANNAVDFGAFTPNQRAAMFSRFLMFRRAQQFSGTFCTSAKRAVSGLDRRQDDNGQGKALAMADLLVNNCTVAIQDVWQEDSIPLAAVELKRISESASSLSATPTPKNTDPGALVPQTMVLGSATATDGGTGTGTATVTGAASTSTSTGAGQRFEGRVGRGPGVVLMVTIVILVG